MNDENKAKCPKCHQFTVVDIEKHTTNRGQPFMDWIDITKYKASSHSTRRHKTVIVKCSNEKCGIDFKIDIEY